MAGKITSENAKAMAAKRWAKKGEKPPEKPQTSPHPQAITEDLNEVAAKPRIPEQAPVRKAGPEAASQKDLENWLGATLGLICFGLALWIADGKEDEGIFEAVALRDDELDVLVPALARVIARSPINKRYGQLLIQSNDWIGAIMALGQYGARVWPLVKGKLERGRYEPVRPLQTIHATEGSATGNGSAPVGGLPGNFPGAFSTYNVP